MRKFFLFISVLVLFSFTGTSLKKRISDSLYRYEFYTTTDVVTAKPEREYFWFKGGKIHNSEYGMAGELLHSDFVKLYHSNQLAEAGKFDRGLKTGFWKTWFENGTLQSKTYWDEGQMDGSCFTYDHTGKIVEQGKYKNNKKHGRWINYVKGDTLKYKNGNLILPKVKDTVTKQNKPSLLQRLFSKKEKSSKKAERDSKKDKKQNVRKKKKNEKQQGTVKKDNFFKRLFSKKDSSKNKEK